MLAFFEKFSPVVQALFGTLYTWGMTALGAAGVFLQKEINQKLLDGMLGFASGVMIAASYFSLLAPAVEMSVNLNVPQWFPAVAGFCWAVFSCGLWIKSCPICIPAIKNRKG